MSDNKKISQLILNGVIHDIQDTATSQGLSQEIKDRGDADSALSDRIDAEETDRKTVDKNLESKINGNYDIVFVARSKTKYIKSTDLTKVMLSQLIEAGVIDEKTDN